MAPVSVKANVTDKQSLSNEEMNLSIESMLEETLEYDETQAAGTAAAKPTSNVTKQPAPSTVSLNSGTKIKMLSSSQFVQLKTLPNQGKHVNYTISKSSSNPAVVTGGATAAASASIGSIVKTLPASSGQQIFTLKTPSGQMTQFVTAASSSQAGTHQKYTVIKNPNGMAMLQLTKNVPAPPAVINQMDLSNIIDMPIVFADNEGNIADQQQQQQQAEQQIKTGKLITCYTLYNISYVHSLFPASSASNSSLIISQKIIKEATNPVKPINPVKPTGIITSTNKGGNIVKGIQQLFTTHGCTVGGSTNKVVYLNRSSMKPIHTGTSGTARLPSGATALPIRIVSSPKTTVGGTTATATTTGGNQVLLDAANVKTLNLQAIKTTAGTPIVSATGVVGGTLRHAPGVVSLSHKFPQFQVIKSPGATSTVGDGKQGLRNLYFKSSTGLKPVQMLANRSPIIPAIAPGGAAVRRVLNIGSVNKPTTVTLATQPAKETP